MARSIFEGARTGRTIGSPYLRQARTVGVTVSGADLAREAEWRKLLSKRAHELGRTAVTDEPVGASEIPTETERVATETPAEPPEPENTTRVLGMRALVGVMAPTSLTRLV